jgi:hypothetical protein
MPAIEAYLQDACEYCASAARSIVTLSEMVISKELELEVCALAFTPIDTLLM